AQDLMLAVAEPEKILYTDDAGAVHCRKRKVQTLRQRNRYGDASAGKAVDEKAIVSVSGVADNKLCFVHLELHKVACQVYLRCVVAELPKAQSLLLKA